MRVIFNEELKQVADDLDRMAQNVRKAIKGAGEALLNQDVEAAQTVIDGDIEIDALESSVIDQCVKLLAKQNPVATDLRVVVSTMRLASTFERMGDLARHVAEAARRTYPAAAIPESAQPVFAEMIDFLDNTADQLVAMLFDRDAKTAEAIRRQAEEKAKQIINDAYKSAESKRRETLLEAKEEIHKSRSEYEREVKERRAELQKQERRLQQKEETLDRKTDTLDKKTDALNQKIAAIDTKQNEINQLKKTQMELLEKISGYTVEEA